MEGWERFLDEAREKRPGSRVEIPKDAVQGFPPGFEETPLHLVDAADAVYRERRKAGPLRLHEHPERYVLARERFHPRHRFFKHAVYDDVGYAGLGVTAVYNVWSFLRGE